MKALGASANTGPVDEACSFDLVEGSTLFGVQARPRGAVFLKEGRIVLFRGQVSSVQGSNSSFEQFQAMAEAIPGLVQTPAAAGADQQVAYVAGPSTGTQKDTTDAPHGHDPMLVLQLSARHVLSVTYGRVEALAQYHR
jgi:hypothetical protein